jgi:glycosyltransferase involved in cell wall biosynthesis
MSPRVSVCMPVYNGEPYLRQAIESILAQSLEDLELVIADDCSTDNSRQIIEGYAARDQRIKFLPNEKNRGLFGNWNYTMQQASGKYIKPFAQDDHCRPNLLERLADALDTLPNVAITSCAREMHNGERVYGIEPDARKYYRDRTYSGQEVTLMFLLEANNLIGFPPAVMFRREHLGRGFDERYFHCGDVEFYLRVLQQGDYHFIYRPLVTYRYHGGNQTYRNFEQLNFMSDWMLLRSDYAGVVAESGVDNFDSVIADHLADVVGVGKRLLNIDFAQVKTAPNLDNERATQIIIALASRVLQLRGTSGATDVPEHAQQEIERINADYQKLTHANQQLHRQIHSLVNSTSWKVTKPLRAVKRLMVRK